jgi:hypothetical protein
LRKAGIQITQVAAGERHVPPDTRTRTPHKQRK